MDLVHCIASLFRHWRKQNSLSRSKNIQFGAEGERIAEHYLRKQGFQLLYRNFRPSSGGEIDLVCRDGEYLVFVEVKRRSSKDYGDPSLAVSAGKRSRLIRGAATWLQLLDKPGVCCRFDVVELLGRGNTPEIRHLKDAFSVPDKSRAFCISVL